MFLLKSNNLAVFNNPANLFFIRFCIMSGSVATDSRGFFANLHKTSALTSSSDRPTRATLFVS